jgi:ankyrin repeat protein
MEDHDPNIAATEDLFAALGRGDVLEIQRLLKHDRTLLEVEREDRLTVLQAAAQLGHVDIVATLLDAGADINAGPSRDTYSVLECACMGGHPAVVVLLLARGAAPTSYALLWASERGHPEVVRALLVHSCGDIDRFCRNGPALWIACSGGEAEVTRLLLRAGADPFSAQADDGATLMRVARCLGHDACVAVLQVRGITGFGHAAVDTWLPHNCPTALHLEAVSINNRPE